MTEKQFSKLEVGDKVMVCLKGKVYDSCTTKYFKQNDIIRLT